MLEMLEVDDLTAELAAEAQRDHLVVASLGILCENDMSDEPKR